MRPIKHLVLALLLGIAASVGAAPYEKAPADVQLFFKNAGYSSMTLSPDGRYIAAIAPNKDQRNGVTRRNLVLIDLADRSKSRFITNNKDQDIAYFFWKGNDRVVFGVDSDGNESFGLYSVGLDGGPVKVLVDAYKLPFGATAQVLHDLDDISADEILIALNERDRRWFDVFRLNIKNGKRTMVARNENEIVAWIPDHQGRVRAAIHQKGVATEVWYRKEENAPWTSLAKFTFPEPTWAPIAWEYDDKTMYVESNIGHDKSAIYRYDPETQKLGELVFVHDQVDAGGMLGSDKQKRYLGVAYYTDKPQRKIWDKDFAELRATLEAEFPGQQVSISSMTKDERRMVLTVYSDRDPGTFYLFDRDKLAMELLTKSRPDIDSSKMSEMRSFSFKSRDGLTLNGYLTVPKDAKGPVPLIVNPHGGPWARDTWGYDPEHQFFAGRGYATIQVNFRGSTGYGRDFLMASYKKWGREMQNDITDTVKWAVEQGIADPDKVCIYGGSYGGYATMAGMTFTPELYKCGVNYVGVTDIALLFTTMPKAWEPNKEVMKLQIGDPDKEAQLLRDASPLFFADRIRAPIFIVQGGRDPRVNRKHAEYLRDAMDDEKKPYEWMLKENEGHGFRKEENRLELYHRMGDFFAKYLAPPTGSAP
jgi:dipeptidyl aminopeptidase/acylaminoacyl peptidase